MTEQERIIAGDATVLDEVSRWDVEAWYLGGKLDGMPKSIRDKVLDIIESCKLSR